MTGNQGPYWSDSRPDRADEPRRPGRKRCKGEPWVLHPALLWVARIGPAVLPLAAIAPLGHHATLLAAALIVAGAPTVFIEGWNKRVVKRMRAEGIEPVDRRRRAALETPAVAEIRPAVWWRSEQADE